MSRLIFDIETNGLLDDLSTIHCLVLKDLDTGEVVECAEQAGHTPVGEGLRLLAQADLIAGHNVIKFDIPAIQKVFPGWQSTGAVRDTLVMSRLIIPKDRLKDEDFARRRKGSLPGNMIGRYALEAWGYRLKEYKGDFKGPWDAWTPEMQAYCVQDVEVTEALWRRLEAQRWPEESLELEHRVQEIIWRQEQHGFLFDRHKAAGLLGELVERKLQLEHELRAVFPPWTVETPFTPKVNNKARGYVKGQVFVKKKVIEFSPGNRNHIADRLTKVRGWQPAEFTAEGRPKVDEAVISSLPYPEAGLLSEYLTVEKRLGQLANGKEAWMKAVRTNGRIYGTVITNGAVTGRMAHAHPNMAQVPAGGSPWGPQCRGLFIAPPGKVLVGCDAAALELRCLAGYMARYDGGAYIQTVLGGKKDEGTDIHSVNAKALGLDPKLKYPVASKEITGRDIAKVWFYAFIYGAGDGKLGEILGKSVTAGKASRTRFLTRLPALGALVQKIKERLKQRDYLIGLDKRRLYVRHEHAALNTLLQGAGAILMKKGLVLLDDALCSSGLVPGVDYEFVANVHDEWQMETIPSLAEKVGTMAAQAITDAGMALNFACPLAGEFNIGPSWAETH